MDLLIKLAQGIALSEGCHSVAIEHVRAAVAMLELQEGHETTDVLEYLHMPRPFRSAPAEIVMRLAQSARTSQPLPLDTDVRQMLQVFGDDYVFYRTPAFLLEAPLGGSTEHSTHPENRSSYAPGGTKPASETDAAATADGAGQFADNRMRNTSRRRRFGAGGQNPFAADLSWPDRLSMVRELREYLGRHLLGQDEVIDQLADGVIYQTLRGERRGPLATLFLVGPPATGKTYTAHLLAEALAGAWPVKTIDMSSLQSSNQAFALTGMSQGYSDAIPGELTDFVRRQPRCIVVLDNLHKAHPNNQSVLLPMFDTGFLTDQFGFFEDNDRTRKRIAPSAVDFRNVILIITTNVASGALQNADFQAYLEQHPEQTKDAIVELLAEQKGDFKDSASVPVFSPELLSRLSAELMLFYKALSLPSLEAIARITWDAFAASLDKAFRGRLHASELEYLLRAATLSFGGQLDARKVAGNSLENLLFGGVIDLLQEVGHAETLTNIHFELAEGFAQTLDRLLAGLNAPDIARELHRKQRALRFDQTTIRQADGSMRVRLAQPHWITPLRSRDLEGAGGLQVVIPDRDFADIAGHEAVKRKLREIAGLLRSPEKMKAWRIGAPRGMLLYGPPGTGKTMLAKALAKEADLPFIATTGPDLLDVVLMREIFDRARHYAPSILFIDEVDILGSRDGVGYPVAINQLLTELDGFKSHTGGVFTVLASNYPEKIDSALLRSGRVDLRIEIPSLDPPAREFFFNRLRTLPGGASLDIAQLVQFSAGMTGAQLEQMHRDLALDIMRTGRPEMNQSDAVEMINIIKYGERRSIKQSRKDLESVAWHEAGHALVSLVLRPERRIEQATIVPRGRAAGFVSFGSEENDTPMTRQDVLNEMAVCLAARTAQQLQFGEAGVDQGAASDLQQATALAEQAICRWGMDDVIGCRIVSEAALSHRADLTKVSDRVSAWIADAQTKARSVLEDHRETLKALALALMEHETLSTSDIASLMGKVSVASLAGT